MQGVPEPFGGRRDVGARRITPGGGGMMRRTEVRYVESRGLPAANRGGAGGGGREGRATRPLRLLIFLIRLPSTSAGPIVLVRTTERLPGSRECALRPPCSARSRRRGAASLPTPGRRQQTALRWAWCGCSLCTRRQACAALPGVPRFA